jgi:hypothetical protein
VAILSGGNVEPGQLAEILSPSASASGAGHGTAGHGTAGHGGTGHGGTGSD